MCMGCAQALNYLEDMSLHAARGGEHVTIELSCRTCPYTPRGVAGKQGSHGKEHETEKENNNKITNEIDIEKGNILIALQNMFGMFLRSLSYEFTSPVENSRSKQSIP